MRKGNLCLSEGFFHRFNILHYMDCLISPIGVTMDFKLKRSEMVATRISPTNSAIAMVSVAMPNAMMLTPHNNVDFLSGIA